MQLGKLRSTIRATKGTVFVAVILGDKEVLIPSQKSGLLKDVLPKYGESVNDETGLSFDDGVLSAVGLSAAQMATAPLDMSDDDAGLTFDDGVDDDLTSEDELEGDLEDLLA